MRIIFKCAVEQVAPNAVEVKFSGRGDLPMPQVLVDNATTLYPAWGISEVDADRIGDKLHALAMREIILSSVEVVET